MGIRLFIVAASALLLSACANQVAITYANKEKSLTEVAVLRGGRIEGQSNAAFVYFSSYSAMPVTKDSFVSVGNSFSGYPTTVRMLPGVYSIIVQCSTGASYAFIGLRLSLTTGSTYEFGCEPAQDRPGYLRAFVSKAYSTTKPEQVFYTRGQGNPLETVTSSGLPSSKDKPVSMDDLDGLLPPPKK